MPEPFSATPLDVPETTRRVARAMARALAADSVGVYLTTDDGTHLRALAGYQVPRRLLDALRQFEIPVRRHRFVEEAAERRTTVTTVDAETDPRVDRETLRRFPLRSVMFAPMFVNETLVGGFFIVWWQAARRFTAEEAQLAEGIAEQAALALRNARLFEETERRRREVEVIADVARSINTSLEPAVGLQSIAVAAKDLCQADLARIALREEGSDTMVVHCSAGTRFEGWRDVRITPGKGSGGHVLVTGRPFRTANYLADDRVSTDVAAARAEGYLAEMVVPVRVEEQTEGLLYVSRRHSRAFTDRDEAVLSQLADHAATAIRNSELFARERAARTLAERAQGSLKLLFASAPLPMAVFDSETQQIVEINAAAIDHYGYTREEFLRLRASDLVHPDDRLAVQARRGADALASGMSHAPVVRHVTKAGRPIDVEVVGHPLHFAGGPAQLVVMIDVTEQRRAFEQLRHSEERFSKVFHTSIVAMSMATLDGRLLDCNERYAELFGYRREEMVGGTIAELGIWADIRDREPLLRRLLAAGSVREVDVRFRRRSGEIFDALMSIESVQFPDETLLVALIADMSERKQAERERALLEEQLRQAQKMEAIGQLAGGIAHDFNNLLTVISGRSEVLLSRLQSADPVRRDVETIHKTADRAAALTRQLLAFSRKQVLQPKIVSLNALVGQLASMLKRLIGENIELTFEPAGDLGAVRVDPSQIEQVVVNLAVNARDAMEGGGRLVIATANADVDVNDAARYVGVTPGRYARLSVADNGVGMDPATQARMFEPFFTTKEPGRGTGLGLATVYGIVQQSGGHIRVFSEPGAGTTFEIYFPRVDSLPETIAAEAPTPIPEGAETVLLAEDDDEVRSLVRDVLEAIGYKVLEAASGAAALAIAARHPGEIALLLTDTVMPEMSGPTLAERLLAQRPATRVLLMSGYTDDATVLHGVHEAGTPFLHKPFSPTVLALKVRQVLDGLA